MPSGERSRVSKFISSRSKAVGYAAKGYASRMFHAPVPFVADIAQLSINIGKCAASAPQDHALKILERTAAGSIEYGAGISRFVTKIRDTKKALLLLAQGKRPQGDIAKLAESMDELRQNLVFQGLVWHIRSIAKADRHCHISPSIDIAFLHERIMSWDLQKAELFLEKTRDSKNVVRLIHDALQSVKAKMGPGIKWEDALASEAETLFGILSNKATKLSTRQYDDFLLDDNDQALAFEHIVRLYYNDGVTDVDVRLNPKKGGAPASHVLGLYNERSEKLESSLPGLKIRYILCFNRKSKPDKIAKAMEEIKGVDEGLKRRIVAVDLSGSEVNFVETKDPSGAVIADKEFFNSNYFKAVDLSGYPVLLHLNDPGQMSALEDKTISKVPQNFQRRLDAQYEYMADTMAHINMVARIGHLWTLLPSRDSSAPGLIVKGNNLVGRILSPDSQKKANGYFDQWLSSGVIFEQLPPVYETKSGLEAPANLPAMAKYMFAPYVYWVNAGLPFSRIVAGIDGTSYGPMSLSEMIAVLMISAPEEKDKENPFSYKNILGMATKPA